MHHLLHKGRGDSQKKVYRIVGRNRRKQGHRHTKKRLIKKKIQTLAHTNKNTQKHSTFPTSTKASSMMMDTLPSILKHMDITKTGQYILWVTFALMALSSIGFGAVVFRMPTDKRTLPMIIFGTSLISTLAYFAMAASEGLIVGDDYSYRTMFVARYVDWAITFPLVLSQIGVIAGATTSSFIILTFFSEITVLSALFGNLDRSHFRWAWFTFWLLFWLPVVKELSVDVRKVARERSLENYRLYNSFFPWVLLLMTLYPVVWALAQGSNVISIDAEITAYSLLDIALKIILGVCVLASHESIDAFVYRAVVSLPRDSEDGAGVGVVGAGGR